jgi:hypothetical protein
MRRVLLWSTPVLVLLAAFGLYWFQPWKLFTAKTVNETAPVVVASAPSGSASATPGAATAVLLGEGKLISHEHATSGTAQLVRLPDGKLQLIFRDLSTSDGPDLHVWLTDQAVIDGSAGWHVFDDGMYYELGRLKGTHGTQVYDVPADVRPDQVKSVTIWCARFSVSFGAAQLL